MKEMVGRHELSGFCFSWSGLNLHYSVPRVKDGFLKRREEPVTFYSITSMLFVRTVRNSQILKTLLLPGDDEWGHILIRTWSSVPCWRSTYNEGICWCSVKVQEGLIRGQRLSRRGSSEECLQNVLQDFSDADSLKGTHAYLHR